MKTKLLRCPFCGSDYVHMRDRGTTVAAQCNSCGVEGPAWFGIVDAVNAWNTRVPHVEPLI